MATLKDVRDYLSVPGKPVTLIEMKELTKSDREDLIAELNKVQENS